MNTEVIRDRLKQARQIAAVCTAFLLPVSTSGEAIAVGVFAVLALLTVEPDHWRAVLKSPAATVPIALFAFVAVSMLWSPSPLGPGGTSHYVKLLLIPIAMATAFTSRQAISIGYAFVTACVILLALSLASLAWPAGPWGWFKAPGLAVKDNAIQSTCFALCAFGMAIEAVRRWRLRHLRPSLVAAALALLFFADVFLIYLSKTGMLIAGTLLVLFLARINGWRSILIIAIPAALVVLVALVLSPAAQRRIAEIRIDVQAISASSPGSGPTVSTASRLDFWQKAIRFIEDAPIIGHGAGSTKSLYQSLESESPSPYGEAVPDPHNQFLAIAIQTGLAGGALLIVMWMAHLYVFTERGFASSIGLAVVLQSFVGSMFNSQISQVTQGTLYCLAVGLVGGIILRDRRNVTVSHQLDDGDFEKAVVSG